MKRFRIRVIASNFKIHNISHRESDRWKTIGDDIQIAIDILQEVKQNDRVILVSGDGDFILVVKAIQHRDVEVTIPNLNHYDAFSHLF